MKACYKIIVFTSIMLFCSGCITPVDQPELDPLDILVLNGLLSDSDTVYVQLTKPVNPTSEAFDLVRDVEVVLTQEGGIEQSFIYDDSLFILPGFEYQPNTNYKIAVLDPQFRPIITSNTKSPLAPESTIVNSNLTFALDSEGYNVASVTLKFKNNPEIPAYFSVRVIALNDIVSNSILYLNSNDPVIRNESEVQLAQENLVFSNEIINSKEYLLNIQFSFEPDYGVNELLVVEFYSLSESLYRYFKSYEVHDFNQEPFNGELINFFEATEPVDLYTNISNGLGIFGALAVQRDTIYVD